MIYVDVGRCTGCGECLDACPTGAIALQNQVAAIEESLCMECEVCLDACPAGAILAVETVEPVLAVAPAGVIQTRPEVAPRPLRDMVLPAVGSALLWTGRELAPRLARLALNLLDRPIQSAERKPLDPGAQRNDQGVRWATISRGRRRGHRRRQRQNNKR